ncbi:hypothetical protein Tco_1074583 [Tanacetum coccineum]
MENLPPPNNDLNILEDEHAPAPEHAPIAPNPAPIQPNGYLANDEADPEEEPKEEEEPIPEQALAAPIGFSPQWIGGHDSNNNNGWIEEDDEDEVEAEEEDEEEMEDDEDEEMKVEDNDGENYDAEVYNPYEEADPLNRPPPSLEIAEREIMNAPITRSTLPLIPPIRQFAGTFYVGEGSSATVFNPALCKVYPPRPMVNDPNTLYSRVKTLTKQMWDRFRVESSSFERGRRNDMRMDSFDDDLTALDSTFREQMQEMEKLRVAEEKSEYNHMEDEYFKNHWDRVSWYYNDLSGWEDNVVRVDVASDCGGESVDTTAIVKDVGVEKDNEGDVAATKDSQPSESSAIRAERERVREEATRAGRLAGGPAAAPVARECTFTRFMKCGPTQFHGTEGAIGHYRWFEKMESTFGIRHEVANGKSCTEVKRIMNIAAYTERFNELALLCLDVVPNEKKKVELYIKGFPEIIKGGTTSSRPTILNDVVRMAHTFIEHKIQTKNERIAEGNKRRWENNNQGGNNNRNINNNHNNNDNLNKNNNNRNNNNHNIRGNYRDNNRHNPYN